MEHNQQSQQWQGTERRQSQGAYTGEDRRRRPQQGAPVQEPSPDDGTRPLKQDQTDIH
jgi:hypothetical protein